MLEAGPRCRDVCLVIIFRKELFLLNVEGTSDSYLVITRVQSQPSHLSDHHVEISARCEEFAVFEPLEFLSFHF